VEIEPLERVLLATIKDAERGVIEEPTVVAQFGMEGERRVTAGDVWNQIAPAADPFSTGRETLARAIASRVASAGVADGVRHAYQELCDCLNDGRRFLTPPPTP
jgi:hypothetical protein